MTGKQKKSIKNARNVVKNIIDEKPMLFSDSIRSSIQTILSHKLRSILTLLGIIIGVMSVVAMFSSIYGIKHIMKSNMEGMGFNNSIYISPKVEDGSQNNRGMFGGFMRFMRVNRKVKPINYTDYEFIRSKVEHKYSYGMIEVWQKSTDNQWIKLRATNNDFFLSKTYPLGSGRYFNAFESRRAAKVCIIGSEYAKEHMEESDPLGKMITIGPNRYLVIGVLAGDNLNKKKGFNFNPWERKMDLEAVYIPLKTGATYLRNNLAIDYLYLQSDGEDKFQAMKSHANQIMLIKHNMSKDFSFQDIGSFFLTINQEMDAMMKKWNLTLMAIATVSLIVGGIGLFSTLLISINERMMEIGIRKSIGASDASIFVYFIMEALLLAFIAATVGILLAMGLIKGMELAIGYPMPIPFWSVIIGFSFSLITGFLSGVYPAFKASKIDPIQAIYYFE